MCHIKKFHAKINFHPLSTQKHHPHWHFHKIFAMGVIDNKRRETNRFLMNSNGKSLNFI